MREREGESCAGTCKADATRPQEEPCYEAECFANPETAPSFKNHCYTQPDCIEYNERALTYLVVGLCLMMFMQDEQFIKWKLPLCAFYP